MHMLFSNKISKECLRCDHHPERGSREGRDGRVDRTQLNAHIRRARRRIPVVSHLHVQFIPANSMNPSALKMSLNYPLLPRPLK